ncbi:hypothetical protein [Cellulomonas dongxiuzhuiae]|uniref:Protein kinase domain-containing protein n=1 Tax=Cellulomonas dongxiuzhuiae TaxID=2819979 RepID=A0ABX8GG04_9CELL|nr:hypothetical protein [Cellulomonas dongxiuzhuiae]MBO3093715.1 hypothetical protein [Cellulomonas dongxiuzhuiae]QWC14823.1 hypothetical protein KKR89_10660 [Cellulomonas dongxiuzhuiae]
MHTAAPPPDDVTRLLQAHGARVASPVGTDGSWWVARPTQGEDGPWLEVLVADVPVDGSLAARAGVLTGLDHPHLARVLAVDPLGPGRVALVCEHVPGPTLAAVRAARPPLADGEVVTVAVPVAQALAVLHAAGLAHGAVGADRVVVRPGGVPVLVDLRGALRGVGTATGDVHRLVAALLGLMPPLDAHLAAGLEDAVRLRDALEALLRGRATPDDVVEAVFAVASPEPVQVPEADELAGAQVALETGRSGVPRSTVPPPPPRRARREPRRRRWWPAVVAAAVLMLGGGAALTVRLLPDLPADAATPSAVASPSATAPGVGPGAGDDRAALADEHDPAAAAAALTRLRAAALAAADAAGVAVIEVAGSPALAADEALVGGLAGARSEGLTVDVTTVTATGTAPDGDVTVEVTSTMSAHVRVAPTGERTDVPATAARTVELVLRWTPAGWRVWDVREPGGATP